MPEKPFKIPGVHIEEVSAPPDPVEAIGTSVPVFIGYTQKADDEGRSLARTPVRISSLSEYERLFGVAAEPRLSLEPVRVGELTEAVIQGGADSYGVRRINPAFHLHQSLVLFFLNGGGPCYIISAGLYEESIDAAALIAALNSLAGEAEPSLVVVPDALSLSSLTDCVTVQQVVLAHCAQSGSRFAILDVHEGYRSRETGRDCIARFRGALGVNHLSHGAAYYPWLQAAMPGSLVVTHRHFDQGSRELLCLILQKELGLEAVEDSSGRESDPDKRDSLTLLQLLAGKGSNGRTQPAWSGEAIDLRLCKLSDAYERLLQQSRDLVSRVPAGGAIAGVYASVDRQRGVWKAPANVSLNGVERLSVRVTDEEQEDLTVAPHGKSVNAVRAFAGRGILVWGARTLDGHNDQSRYISVRRTLIMMEQSVRRTIRDHVFEPNDERTWSLLKSLIEDFLVGIWRQGGFSGSRPEEAFAVRLGLGETMTEQDILHGQLRIVIMVAPLRPAEFIVIRISQQMMVH